MVENVDCTPPAIESATVTVTNFAKLLANAPSTIAGDRELGARIKRAVAGHLTGLLSAAQRAEYTPEGGSFDLMGLANRSNTLQNPLATRETGEPRLSKRDLMKIVETAGAGASDEKLNTAKDMYAKAFDREFNSPRFDICVE